MSSEEQHLLMGILAEPQSDLKRLVYADWLQENGRESRAELIRVQCEMAVLGRPHDEWMSLRDYLALRVPPSLPIVAKDDSLNILCLRRPGPRPADFEQYRLLRGRESTLLVACDSDLRRHLPEWVPLTTCEDVPSMGRGWPASARVSRGFVSSLSLSKAELFGGPCPDCLGLVPVYQRQWGDCGRCDGRQSIRGLAAATFATMPITSVRLTDFAAARLGPGQPHEGQCFAGSGGVGGSGSLPEAVFARVMAGAAASGPTWLSYTDLTRLMDAVSDACVAVCRESADLPQLPPRSYP